MKKLIILILLISSCSITKNKNVYVLERTTTIEQKTKVEILGLFSTFDECSKGVKNAVPLDLVGFEIYSCYKASIIE